MINQPTVLILGAGASMDFQYPSGRQLMERVIEITNSPTTDAFRCLVKMGYTRKDIEEFGIELQYSGRTSVDVFLEYRQQFIEIGKSVMALELIRLENVNTLFRTSDNWYEYLFNRMDAPFSEFGNNKISFITFNYDRSLETYLHKTLMSAYGVTSGDAAEMISNFPIIQVHGKLGDLPWQADSGRLYFSTIVPDEIRKAAEGIRIISESSQVDEAFGSATELISNSKRVVFLGFGFHTANLDRLSIDLTLDQLVWGSCFGLTNLQKKEIESYFERRNLILGHRAHKVLQFLEENILL